MVFSKSLLDTFYISVTTQEARDYRGYKIRFLKRNKELRLEKSGRQLASWFLESNECVTYNHCKTPAEKSFVRKFILMPDEIERKYQEEQRKTNDRTYKDSDVVIELKANLKKLKIDEISYESLDHIVSGTADKFADDWYDIGIHPDKYADNYPMYFGFAKSRVWSELASIRDTRIEEGLKKKARLIPIRAQREGNLVLINELDHKRFTSLVSKAIQYAEDNFYKLNPLSFLPSGELKVLWWEKHGEMFFDRETFERNEAKSLREQVLNSLLPKPESQPKPSRVEFKVRYQSNEIQADYRCPQKGILEWK